MYINSVELFNKIVYDKNKEAINNKIYEKILVDFFQYVLLKNIIRKGMLVDTYIENDKLYFLITIDNRQIYNSILKLDHSTIKKKKKKYTTIVVKKSNNSLIVNFIKE